MIVAGQRARGRWSRPPPTRRGSSESARRCRLEARRLCPTRSSPVDIAHYRAQVGEVMGLIDELGVPAEPVSLDEVYLDLSTVHVPGRAMSGLVGRIRDELGLDASVGIGPNKLVAKVASDAEKPRGFVVLTREQAAERFAGEPSRLIPGSARRPPSGSRRSASDDRRRFSAARSRPDRALRRAPRPPSTTARTSAPTAGRPERVRSRARSRRLRLDIDDLGGARGVLGGRRGAGGRARERGLAGRTIAIKVRPDDFDDADPCPDHAGAHR